mmetsp:Transcript_57496/g.136771  ORF Transcript_57496/g.136771 Transcript_57496/m.136771 type:complete len:398 (+) Transcript_57496:117-1310(+)|eukprot:CAMPEP_0178411664 /NCGR_PEP_ID=MMETSP0689_2-20121128/21608_1 /TAXON_ID=160604 /ORGANISM="Amphidinium massartii, Strain CS-259" /LENGTH=397 /DNA_ID=CAMNT_0020032871 /DNA_START=105 /DNA_END=1301 /DNA_ORIENTATION=+
MTNYNAWDAKTKALTEEAEAEEKREKEENDKALGLDGPKGPPVAKSQEQMKGLAEHSQKRKEFIEWNNSRELTLTHNAESGPSTVDLTCEVVRGKAVRLRDSKGVTYTISAEAAHSMIKLMVERCQGVNIELRGSLITSTIEICRCEDLHLELDHPLGTLQVDECAKNVRIHFAEREHLGGIYHHNSPGLAVSWPGCQEAVGGEAAVIGKAEQTQYSTRLSHDGQHALVTAPVRRGEGEFPIDLPSLANGARKADPAAQPEPEEAPLPEQRQQMAQQKRQEGNEMFRANDFMQAAMSYTEALELDPTLAAVWSNRAQCWLKLGEHSKAYSDAVKCTELDAGNAKGWFRKGMSLHAQKQYREALPALLEAEKLDPKNKQITEAIRFAQLMARKEAASG